MLRKLLWVALSTGLAKKLFDRYARPKTPFPTARRHPPRSR